MQRLIQRNKFTTVLLVAWLGILGYILATGSLLGYIILAVLTVFVLVPAVLLTLLTRADARRAAATPTAQAPQSDAEPERPQQIPQR